MEPELVQPEPLPVSTSDELSPTSCVLTFSIYGLYLFRLPLHALSVGTVY